MKSYIPNQHVIAKLEEEEVEVNRDFSRRDLLLGLNTSWDDWNAQHNNQHTHMKFENLNVEQFELLLLDNYIEPDSGLIGPPPEKDIFLFLCKYPSVRAYGEVGNPTNPNNPDYTIRIEGIYVAAEHVTPELREDFIEFGESADELSDDDEGLMCWWD